MSACVSQYCLLYSPENIRKALDLYVFRGMKREPHSPFCFITNPFMKQCSSRAENSQLICRINFCLVMIDNLTISNCTADKSVTVSWTINQTFPDDINNVTYLEDYQKSDIYWEFDKVSNAFSLNTFRNTRRRQKHAQIR